ncbi:MAG: Gfo/Idh/MocA family oxidoreductase [Candidatus Woesearchaeota archaeon]
MIKAGIIGCGKIAGYYEKKINPNTHAGAYLTHDLFKLEVCYDIIKNKTINFAKKYNCHFSKNLDEFLNTYSLDVVSVTTPDDTHYEILKKILLNKIKPRIIFLEKPACETKNEFEEIIRLSKKYKVKVVVNLSRRFDELHNYLRNLIKRKTLGSFVSGIGTYYGGLKHNGVHLIDTLIYLLNENFIVLDVFGVINEEEIKDPTIEFRIKTIRKNRIISVFGFNEKQYQLFELDLRFTKGRIRIEDFGTILRIEKRFKNNIGENILKPHNVKIVKKNSSLINALNIIAGHLLKNRDIKKYDIISTNKTMNLIWKIEDEYKIKFRA